MFKFCRSAALALPVPTAQKHRKILGKSWENYENMSTESPETGKGWETRHDSVIHLGKLRLLQRFVNIVGLCKIGKSLKMGKEMKGTNILQSFHCIISYICAKFLF